MKQVTLLLVDDEPPFLEAIRDYLSEYTEFYIECAVSGEEALEKIKTGRYDAVVSDYNMPEMTGVELLKGVRSFSRIPFILFTGMGEREIIDEAIENDVDYYLEKGEDLHILAFKLSQMILAGVYQSRKEEAGI
ncbi:response regulator [Methanospirillum hungatei]|uniref:response regulator n=1 Tax=Methanospirillum hungatei TaxID=2203 RepID=UPI0026E9F323|nr:response regulator [Methanospirillum hungatei]MCA1917180.1 response regulator [Methanospirillum hungatei]